MGGVQRIKRFAPIKAGGSQLAVFIVQKTNLDDSKTILTT